MNAGGSGLRLDGSSIKLSVKLDALSLVEPTGVLNPPIVYATGRSEAVVPVLFLFCVALWFILRALHVLKSSRALCPRVSSFFLAL